MSDTEVLITQQCSSVGDLVTYAKKGNNEVIQIKRRSTIFQSFQFIANFMRELLLPQGYPDSVSEDYFEYQLWDTAQAFCSTITGAFTTRAVLKGVGVGDAEATALSAAITWIMKEGTGMISRIVFAWWKGTGLDSNCKKWRFFADILNDTAMLIELFVPHIDHKFSMQILCVTSAMKSIVGVAGGATRASITHHQSIKDNMAEVSAKDGSQETVVNLLASFLSIYLLNIFNGTVSEWILILFLMVLHLVTNFLAVKSLVFKTFNNQRMALLLKTYFNVGTVLNPQKINIKESVLLGSGLKGMYSQVTKSKNMQPVLICVESAVEFLTRRSSELTVLFLDGDNIKHYLVSDFCGFKIIVGEPLNNALKKYSIADLQQTLSVYQNKKYFIIVDILKRKMYVSFERGEYTETIVAAYFHATCLAIATCIYNGIELDIYSKRQLHHPTPITRLYTFMKTYGKSNNIHNIPHNHLLDFNEFVRQEYSMFYTALEVNGWNLETHSLNVGEWRTEWKSHCKKTL